LRVCVTRRRIHAGPPHWKTPLGAGPTFPLNPWPQFSQRGAILNRCNLKVVISSPLRILNRDQDGTPVQVVRLTRLHEQLRLQMSPDRHERAAFGWRSEPGAPADQRCSSYENGAWPGLCAGASFHQSIEPQGLLGEKKEGVSRRHVSATRPPAPSGRCEGTSDCLVGPLRKPSHRELDVAIGSSRKLFRPRPS